MRGTDEASEALFSYVDLEERVPAKHPLCLIRRIVNDALPRYARERQIQLKSRGKGQTDICIFYATTPRSGPKHWPCSATAGNPFPLPAKPILPIAPAPLPRNYTGKWVTEFEKAAYRGGCRSLPELP